MLFAREQPSLMQDLTPDSLCWSLSVSTLWSMDMHS